MDHTARRPTLHGDAELVEGTWRRDHDIERELYKRCRAYYADHYHAVFFAPDVERAEIFQESFITLWESIERRKLYVVDGRIMAGKGQPLTCGLMTWFMAVARNKYREWARDNMGDDADADTRRIATIDVTTADSADTEQDAMLDVIADCVARMPERCRQILTMFYYERQSLDGIMKQLTTFGSKDALKTAKHKCLTTLRQSATAIMHTLRNK